MPYPEQINLPFNFALIRDAFELRHPSPQEPQEPGFWAVIQGNSVVLEEEMLKIADTQMDHNMTANLYRKQIGMIKTALGRGSAG